MLANAGIDTTSFGVLFENDHETLYRLVVPVGQELITWKKLRSLVDLTAYWPVIIGTEQNFRRVVERMNFYQEASKPDTQAIIAAGLALDPVDWVNREGQQSAEVDPHGTTYSEWPDQIGPAKAGKDPFFGHRKASILPNEPLSDVYIGLVPTRQNWQLPAYLKFGGWIGCPQPEVHVSLFKHWDESYGLNVMVMDADSVTIKVDRTPRRRDDALQLAKEHIAYNREIGRHEPTLGMWAASLVTRHSWSFRWDHS